MERKADTLSRFVDQSHAGTLIPKAELAALLGAVADAAVTIVELLQGAGLHQLEMPPGSPAVNASGDVPSPLDLHSNNALLDALGATGLVSAAASEELAQPRAMSSGGSYLAAFDPLDGSSNLDSGITVGTILGAWRGATPQRLLPGRDLALACYVLYGTFTQLMYCAGEGVHLFTLDRASGQFILIERDVRHAASQVYSVNEAHQPSWPPAAQRWLAEVKRRNHATRYIGSLVADFHRNLMKGGMFAYPSSSVHPSGKLRLLYEGAPLAFIAEGCGGGAVDDAGRRVLDIAPEQPHQRTSLLMGDAPGLELFRSLAARDSKKGVL